MQPNTITLTVDEQNDGATTTDATIEYERYDEYQNRSVYSSENHSLDSRDLLSFSRSFPTKNGNFRGVGKSTFKFTRDISVDGVDGVAQLVTPMIMEVKLSAPVGVSDAEILKFRQTALALLDDDTVMTPLNSQLQI